MTVIKVEKRGGQWMVRRDGRDVESHAELRDARRRARRLAQEEGVTEVEVQYPRTGFSSILCL